MNTSVVHKMLVAVIVWCLLAAAGHAASTPPVPSDTQSAEIKRRLERVGFRVTEVAYAPATANGPAVWVGGTMAKYDQPNWDRVTDQALTVWNIMFGVLKNENPQVWLSAPQDWKTYRLFVTTTLAKIVAFDQGVKTAQTDADRQKVFQALYAGITLRVIDLQTKKLVDDKDFIKNYFK
ncbi:MAG TPA: hypothetical protein VFM39_07105 [bacterium]|nr:hypothetical protein [bacterium]